MQPWFDQQTAGMVGGMLGAGVGVFFGGVLGGVGGPLAAKGKCRSLVMGGFVLAIVTGLGLIATGVVALAMGQPWHVWYSFLLPGFITTVVMGSLFPVMRMAYRRAEQRRLDAASIRGTGAQGAS
ncbi:MAG: hypothetical protein RBS39_01975 [Phycisphaerales bacterium]|jgi:hypothetical protein|nr:hypothetical protein [Phycisphaerales bacterium]